VKQHIEGCPDCRAFLEDFGEVAGFLSGFHVSVDSAGDLLENTFQRVRGELRSQLPQASTARKHRTVLAASIAVFFAPVLLIMNYMIAAGGQMVLTRWLPPVVGWVFFVLYAVSAVCTISIAYGSLPLLMAAARNVLRVGAEGGGLRA
jgi:hypothetical protein